MKVHSRNMAVMATATGLPASDCAAETAVSAGQVRAICSSALPRARTPLHPTRPAGDETGSDGGGAGTVRLQEPVHPGQRRDEQQDRHQVEQVRDLSAGRCIGQDAEALGDVERRLRPEQRWWRVR